MTRGRGAERFHALVEKGSTSDVGAPEYPELLAVVDGLRDVPPPVADPAFVATLRDRLIAEAEQVLAAAAAERKDTDARLRLKPVTQRARRRHRRLAAAVSGAVLVTTSAAMAYASQSALPGDGLYPIKRGIESAHAELTFDRADRGRVLLENAGVRLDEAQQLARSHADPTRVDDALDAFTAQAVAGSDLLVSDYESTGDQSAITSVRSFTVTSMNRLDDLQTQMTLQSLGPLLHASQALDQVQQTSVQVCPSCQGPVLGSLPRVLAEANRATQDAWQVAVPNPQGHQVLQGPDGGPVLPDIKGQLPPASVTNPDDTDLVTEPVTPPTAIDVQHTVQNLTDGLTGDQQNDVASTVADTATNLLDAVGQVGNQVASTLDNTVGGLVGGLLSTPSP
ncbi:MAG: DUF5667 domain-containing protein [Nocardioides sp.]